jgi:hypothetical protein
MTQADANTKLTHTRSELGAALVVKAQCQGRFHNLSAAYTDMFPAPVGHVDQRNDFRSAISPTAYFVDLLRLVEGHVHQPADDDLKSLKKRRPDLFEMKLGRKNAEHMVPYLQIANKVMRTYLEQTLQVTPSALEALAQSHFPFSLPFHLPLTQIRSYLAHFGIGMSDIHAAFRSGSDDVAWAAETLNLAPGEFSYLATADITEAALNEAYGVASFGDTFPVHGVDAAIFLGQTDLAPAQLHMLPNLRLPGSAPLTLSLVSVAEAAPVPFINGLDVWNLDHLSRFTRLANRMGWSLDDLNWALASINSAALDSAALTQLASIEHLRAKYTLPVDVLCSFWSDLRTTPPFDQPDGDSLFARNFDTGLLGQVLDTTSPPEISAANKHRAALLGALNVDSAGCDAMLRHLRALDGRSVAGSDDGSDTGSFTLDLHTLSRLYRFSKLARVLGMPIAEYLALLTVIAQPGIEIATLAAPHLAKAEVTSINDVHTVADWADWLASTGLNAFQLQYLTGVTAPGMAPATAGKVLTASAAMTAVNNYLAALPDCAVKPAAFACQGVDIGTATAVFNQLVTGQLLDAAHLVCQPSAAITEDAITALICQRLFALTDAGFFYSDDVGESWTPSENRFLPAPQVVVIGDRLLAPTNHQGLACSDDNGARWGLAAACTPATAAMATTTPVNTRVTPGRPSIQAAACRDASIKLGKSSPSTAACMQPPRADCSAATRREHAGFR